MCAEEGTCFVTGTAIRTASEAQMETVGSALLHPPCKAGTPLGITYLYGYQVLKPWAKLQ